MSAEHMTGRNGPGVTMARDGATHWDYPDFGSILEGWTGSESLCRRATERAVMPGVPLAAHRRVTTASASHIGAVARLHVGGLLPYVWRATIAVLLSLPPSIAYAQQDAPPSGATSPPGSQSDPPPVAGRSPWLFVPLVSSNPKLGTSLGAMVGYIHKFDAVSEPSLLALQAQRSNTSSRTLGLGGKAFWNENRDRLMVGIASGKVTNDYLDFLGTGQEVRSDENVRGYFLRYQHQIRPNWYIGGQALYSNYDVEGTDPTSEQILDMAGLAGEIASGVGLIVARDSRDNTSNPTQGALLQLHNFAFRESLGSDADFDVATGEVKWYTRTGDKNVLVLHGKMRLTHDAPASKQSTVELRGYTRGQYLGRNSLTLEAEDRYMFRPRWGAKLFAGLACLYGDGESCSGDNLYPMVGGGVFYVVKPASNMVITAELAKGDGENRGFYVNFGHRF
ncbi:BamA/TamA family outer membrane protein [Lysobacter soli]|uniref:BamA/TamA family outer membrane protein n=1 Tax=Lysobacter soli TaxID=453783 RepID=UPI0037C74DF8